MLEFLLSTFILFGLAIPAYLIFGQPDTPATSGRIGLGDLQREMNIAEGNSWDVTILRRSGFVHDAWHCTGSAQDALQSAIRKMRQARIEDVRIAENNINEFRVLAYHESQGSRRTGKYVGGFVINRA